MRLAGQLGGEGEIGSRPLVVGDHRMGVPS